MTSIFMDNALPARSAVPAQRRLPWRAMATALALEAIVLGLTTGWLARETQTPPPARTAAPMMLSMVEPEPAVAPAPVVKPMEPAKPIKPLAAPVKHEAAPKPSPSHALKTAPASHEAATPDAPPIKTVSGADAPPAPSAAPAPAPAPAAPPVNTAAGPDDRFVAKLRAAVQAAVVYPMALRGMGLAASIDVEFVYADGIVSNVHVTRPGRVATLDQAAIAAVQRATMPSPPPNLAGTPHAFKVRVIFSEA